MLTRTSQTRHKRVRNAHVVAKKCCLDRQLSGLWDRAIEEALVCI